MPETVIPARYQPPLPRERLVLAEPPDAEAIEMDVVFVGGGPAGLAGAIELARLVKEDAAAGGALGELQIAVLEKAPSLGEHSLSGAVVNPRAFHELFPDARIEDFPFRQRVTHEEVLFLTREQARRIPTPPSMRNHGFFTASICEIVRWLGERAEESGVNILPGFPVASLLARDSRVVGVRTVAAGLGPGTRTLDPDRAEVRDVEHDGAVPTCPVLVEDPRVLDRHLPSGKVHELATGRSVLVDEWSLSHRHRSYWTPSSSTSKISVALGGMTPPAPRAPTSDGRRRR